MKKINCTKQLLLLLALAAITEVMRVEAEPLTLFNSACLAGNWESTDNTKAASLALQFDGNGRVLVTIRKDASYVPVGLSLPSLQELRTEKSSGLVYFSIPKSDSLILRDLLPGEVLLINAKPSAAIGATATFEPSGDTRFVRVSGTARCTESTVASAAPQQAVNEPTAPMSASEPEDDSYSIVQAVHGVGAVFIGIGEPVLFPIARARTCKTQSGSDLSASGCAFVGFLVSPFLSLRDGLVGLGDLATGGYFKLSQRSGVFDYFKPEPPKTSSKE